MTCREALDQMFSQPGLILSRDDVYQKFDEQFPEKPWKRSTLYHHLQAYCINHPGRRFHPQTEGKCFLYFLGDARFRRWNPETDGIWVLKDNMVQPLGESEIDLEDAGDEEEGLELVVSGPVSLSIEKDLENSIVQNLEMLEPGLKLYQEGGKTGQQFDTEVGIIDLLAVDKSGALVVIELKAGSVGDKVCGQIARYIGWIRKNLAKGQQVRGIVVASEFSEGSRYAADVMGSVQLKKYEIEFKFTDLPPV